MADYLVVFPLAFCGAPGEVELVFVRQVAEASGQVRRHGVLRRWVVRVSPLVAVAVQKQREVGGVAIKETFLDVAIGNEVFARFKQRQQLVPNTDLGTDAVTRTTVSLTGLKRFPNISPFTVTGVRTDGVGDPVIRHIRRRGFIARTHRTKGNHASSIAQCAMLRDQGGSRKRGQAGGTRC